MTKLQITAEEKRRLVEERFGKGPYTTSRGIMGCSFVAFHYLPDRTPTVPQPTGDTDLKSKLSLEELRHLYERFFGKPLPEDFRWQPCSAAPSGTPCIRIHNHETHIGATDVLTVVGPEADDFPYELPLRGTVWQLYSVNFSLRDPDCADDRPVRFYPARQD